MPLRLRPRWNDGRSRDFGEVSTRRRGLSLFPLRLYGAGKPADAHVLDEARPRAVGRTPARRGVPGNRAAILQALVGGKTPPDAAAMQSGDKQNGSEVVAPIVNVPLKDSENERARELVTLDNKFIADIAEMKPKASAYVRRRPFMTPELMQKFRCGYLPNDAGSLLRGHFVYGWPDANGDILTWFGRNLNYEEQHEKWKRSGDSKDEPSKFRFVKGFHRGLELYGEDIFRREAKDEYLRKIGVIVVEGPNDVVALNALGVPAVAVCSNTVTGEQANKLASLANEIGSGAVSVMFDLDREGANGAKQVILELATLCRVRYAWTPELAGGLFKGRQPESVTIEEWKTTIHPALAGLS